MCQSVFCTNLTNLTNCSVSICFIRSICGRLFFTNSTNCSVSICFLYESHKSCELFCVNLFHPFNLWGISISICGKFPFNFHFSNFTLLRTKSGNLLLCPSSEGTCPSADGYWITAFRRIQNSEFRFHHLSEQVIECQFCLDVVVLLVAHKSVRCYHREEDTLFGAGFDSEILSS